MTNRERTLNILRGHRPDRMVLTHFGFWGETIEKFLAEKRFRPDEFNGVFPHNNTPEQHLLAQKLGFDFGWEPYLPVNFFLDPPFARELLETRPDGTRLVRDQYGAVELEADDAGSIPAQVDHLLKDRASFEEHYRQRLHADAALRVNRDRWLALLNDPRFGGDQNPRRFFVGSLYGRIRNAMGVENLSFLYYDDPGLLREMVDMVGELTYQNTKYQLELGRAANVRFDYAHFWEDICFRNGPLVVPEVFAELTGPHYRRITALLKEHGVDFVSLDCDGNVASLAPFWLECGVNVMFPIELGVWDGNYGTLRQLCGKSLCGVGGVNKFVFAADYAAIDREIERIRPYIELGNYIPCPDHRIPPEAKWENIQYYCDRIKNLSW